MTKFFYNFKKPYFWTHFEPFWGKNFSLKNLAESLFSIYSKMLSNDFRICISILPVCETLIELLQEANTAQKNEVFH